MHGQQKDALSGVDEADNPAAVHGSSQLHKSIQNFNSGGTWNGTAGQATELH